MRNSKQSLVTGSAGHAIGNKYVQFGLGRGRIRAKELGLSSPSPRLGLALGLLWITLHLHLSEIRESGKYEITDVDVIVYLHSTLGLMNMVLG